MSGRGFSISVAIGCFIMASVALGAVGFYGELGVGVNTGAGDSVDEVTSDVTSEVDTPAEDSSGGSGFLDAAQTGLRMITSLATWPAQLLGILQNLGVPSAIAYPFWAVAMITVAITMGKFIRGVF